MPGQPIQMLSYVLERDAKPVARPPTLGLNLSLLSLFVIVNGSLFDMTSNLFISNGVVYRN
jgi:hypothetical protein